MSFIAVVPAELGFIIIDALSHSNNNIPMILGYNHFCMGLSVGVFGGGKRIMDQEYDLCCFGEYFGMDEAII